MTDSKPKIYSEIDKAIESLAGRCVRGASANEAMQLAQAALNLAHAKSILMEAAKTKY